MSLLESSTAPRFEWNEKALRNQHKMRRTWTFPIISTRWWFIFINSWSTMESERRRLFIGELLCSTLRGNGNVVGSRLITILMFRMPIAIVRIWFIWMYVCRIRATFFFFFIAQICIIIKSTTYCWYTRVHCSSVQLIIRRAHKTIREGEMCDLGLWKEK